MSGFEASELVFEHEGKRIFGRVYLPDEAQEGKRVPMVICAHGLNGSADKCDAYASEIAKRGYAAYCFDFGGARGSRSTGEQLEMTLSTQRDDLEFVYERLSELPYVDLNNVFLFGMSMGAAICALVCAGRYGGRVKGLILLYPAFDIPVRARGLCAERESIPESIDVCGFELSRAFLEDACELDFFSVIGAYRGPVLILHGTADEIVPSGYSVRAAGTYDSAQLELIEGLGHGFEGGARKYAVKKIVGFLDEEADLPDESGLGGDLNFGASGMFG